MATYRFFKNPRVSMDVLLTAHTEATIERIRQQRIVLVPQDTTSLNYSTHPISEGLGPIGTKRSGAIGLLLHDTVAFSEQGTPLGILDAQVWARDPNDKGKRQRRKSLPIEQKESRKWLRSFRKVAAVQKLCPNTKLISIGDRELTSTNYFSKRLRMPTVLTACAHEPIYRTKVGAYRYEIHVGSRRGRNHSIAHPAQWITSGPRYDSRCSLC
jgi:hypothetical protein